MAPAEPRRSEWILLGEDTQHLNFLYHWLRGLGVPGAKIRRRPVAAGVGAGEQRVRQQFAEELQSLRRRNYLTAALLVMIDADTVTVERRIAELEGELPRQPGDRVAIAVPRRNIETWIRYFVAPPVDEETDYKRTRGSDDPRLAGQRLARLREAPDDAPDSLRRFFREIGRVLPGPRAPA